MDYQAAILSQYQAGLRMLRQAIAKCPDSLWNDADDKNKFWHVGYHVLFYTHFYLSEREATFQPWAKFRPDQHFLGPQPFPPYRVPVIGEPYTQPDLLEYVALCLHRSEQAIPVLALDAPSGFDWLPMNKFELQIYNLRHLQQHTGELMERLGARANISVDWIGTSTW